METLGILSTGYNNGMTFFCLVQNSNNSIVCSSIKHDAKIILRFFVQRQRTPANGKILENGNTVHGDAMMNGELGR